MKALKLSMVAGLSALALAACSNAADNAEGGADTTTNDTMVQDETATAADPMASGTTAGTTASGQNLVALAQGNSDLSTLVSAVTAAGLGETLSGPGPFTVFAPTNAAFAKVDKATLDGLMKPDSKAKLSDILKYHVVAGNVKAADLAKQIKDGGGTATLKTVNGANLKASLQGDKVILTDAKGGKSTVTATDIAASNGVVHTIDTVVMP
ncbi:MAG: fasciclin domain-containing protein [Sphingorhabdus sp.]